MDEQSVGLDFIADMADALGVSRYSLLASIDGWSDIVSERSCDLMHGPSNDAMLQTEDDGNPPGKKGVRLLPDLVRVRIVGARTGKFSDGEAGAGMGTAAVDIEWSALERRATGKGNMMGVVVGDDAMSPNINVDEIAIFDVGRTSGVQDGEVIVATWKGIWLIRGIFTSSRGGDVVLRARNPRFGDISIKPGDPTFIIRGVVVGVQPQMRDPGGL